MMIDKSLFHELGKFSDVKEGERGIELHLK